jgi:hypothetical protein
MAQTSFSAQIDAHFKRTKENMRKVFIEATNDLAEDVLLPGPSVAATNAAIKKGLGTKGRGRNKLSVQGPPKAPGHGGSMPVDTGFLRASMVASNSGPQPMRADARPQDGQSYTPTGEVTLIINGTQLGQRLWLTFIAAYARRVNYGFNGTDSLGRKYNQRGYFFVQKSAQKWQRFVSDAVKRVRGAS